MNKHRFHISKGRLIDSLSGWLLMTPSLVLFTFFIWEPLFANARLSLYNTKGFKAVSFAGLTNYAAVFADPVFGRAMLNTLIYILWSIGIGFLLPVLIGLALNEVVYFKWFFRIGIYLPSVIPGVATVMMWALLMSPGESGALNMLMSQLGMKPYAWLNDTNMTIAWIVATMTWKGAGATALMYLARFKGIDQSYYEAAAIDGAGIRQRLRHITIPLVAPLVGTMLVLQIISVFQVLYEPLVMTGGGPNNASLSLMQLQYNYAFSSFDASKSGAVGVITCLTLLSLTIVYNKLNDDSIN